MNIKVIDKEKEKNEKKKKIMQRNMFELLKNEHLNFIMAFVSKETIKKSKNSLGVTLTLVKFS